MTKVSMENFLRTGEFGPVRLGDCREQVLAYLGEPSHRGKPKKLPEIFWYGVFEFYFLGEAETLNCIYCDEFEFLSGSPSIELDSWGLKGKVEKSVVEEFLVAARIEYCPARTGDERLSGFRTMGGVELLFFQPVNSDFAGLYSIGLEKPFETTPKAMKQVSLAIPMEIYEVIRLEALRTGVKIGKICSQWITERANTEKENPR